MKSLLWKDYRLNRLLLIFGFAVCIGPWIIAASRNIYLGIRPEDVSFWTTTAAYSLGLSLVTFAMLGGNAVAAERSDRSAEFLAYMPVSRWSILISKSILTLSAGAAIWLVNWFALFVVAPRVSDIMGIADFAADPTMRQTLGLFGTTSILLFGAGWFWSAVLGSHGLATGMSAFALATVIIGLIGLEHGLGLERFMEKWFLTVSLIVGIGGYVAGCTTYVLRADP